MDPWKPPAHSGFVPGPGREPAQTADPAQVSGHPAADAPGPPAGSLRSRLMLPSAGFDSRLRGLRRGLGEIALGSPAARRQVGGVWRLTRFPEYVWFVPVTTLLGAAVGGGVFGWRLIGVLLANWLAVAFAFMINDVEDAPDDALNPAKVGRNPVSSGDISPRTARLLSFAVAASAAILYLWLGLLPFLIGAACLALAYLYSARMIRLKAIPVADLLSHALMLAGLQFLTGYFSFDGGQPWHIPFPLVFVLAISLYGQLFNELRDLEGDVEAGVTHTAYYIGIRAATALMIVLFAVGVAAAVSTVVVVRLIPTWVLLLMGALAAVLVFRPVLRLHRSRSTLELQHGFQKPLEIAGAVALVTWFAAPPALAAAGWLTVPLMERWAVLLTLWPK